MPNLVSLERAFDMIKVIDVPDQKPSYCSTPDQAA